MKRMNDGTERLRSPDGPGAGPTWGERRWVALFLVTLLAFAVPSCTTVGNATLGGTIQKQSHEMAQQIADSGMLLDAPDLTDRIRLAAGDPTDAPTSP